MKMLNIINEAVNVSRSKDLRDNPIAFIDPNSPENKNTYEYRQIFKDYGAEWSKSPRFNKVFPPHSQGFWFWYVGKTKDSWINSFEKRIKPALEKIHSIEGVSDDDSKTSIIASLDAIIEKVKSAEPSYDSDAVVTNETKEKILNKLNDFKNQIINIGSDEEFKETLKKIIAFKSAQGHEFSLGNTFLVMVQNSNATLVKSRSNWQNLYNRVINKDAKPIFLWKPAGKAIIPYNKEEKGHVINAFLKSVDKRNVKDLTPQENERLTVKLSGKFTGRQFELYDAYDIADTTLVEGKEDLIAPSLKTKEDIKWHTDDNFNDEVRPIYDALISYAEDQNIAINLVDASELGGSKGVSSSGKIRLIKNEGNDVGLTQTLAHEISHELLHQQYLQSKNPQLKNYFVGVEEGRAMVEQQAELTSWMVMAAFGFDLKTTSLNYVAIWGGRPENMISVFDTVAKVANYLISQIVSRNVELKEEDVDVPIGIKKYDANDVANMLGVDQEFQDVLNKKKEKDDLKNTLMETFNRFIGKNK